MRCDYGRNPHVVFWEYGRFGLSVAFDFGMETAVVLMVCWGEYDRFVFFLL